MRHGQSVILRTGVSRARYEYTPPPPPTGTMKWWNGSTWVEKPVKVWNGSAWVTKPVKRWTGSAWEIV